MKEINYNFCKGKFYSRIRESCYFLFETTLKIVKFFDIFLMSKKKYTKIREILREKFSQ